MIWGCLSGLGMGPVIKIDGIMDRSLYENMSLTWEFQHDNDPKHTSKLVKYWLAFRKIDVMRYASA